MSEGAGLQRLSPELVGQLEALLLDCKLAAEEPALGDGSPEVSAQDCEFARRRADLEVKNAILAVRRVLRDAGAAGPRALPAVPAEGSEESTAEEESACWRRAFGTSPRRYRTKTRELERDTWNRFEETKDLDFFRDICIARDGGFSEVDQLWYPLRIPGAIFMILFIISNLYVIISVDVRIILGRSGIADTTNFVIMPLIRSVMRLLRIPADVPLDGAGTICVIELVLLALLIGQGLFLACRAWRAPDEWTRWRSIELVVWKTLPELSTYSGMRLLHFASPSVLTSDFLKFVSYSYSRWDCRPRLLIWKWSKFVVLRVFCFIVGLDSFLVKVHAVSAFFSGKDGGIRLWTLYQLSMFLVQVLGIVQLTMFVRNRLFMFIFGGEDGVLEMHEKNLKQVWNAMLVREIWRHHSCFRFVVILLSFSDVDFQMLVLNSRGVPPPLESWQPVRMQEVSDSDDSESNAYHIGETDDEIDDWFNGHDA